MRLGMFAGICARFAAALVLAVLFAPMPAVTAQTSDDTSTCGGQSEASLEAKIRACSSLIASQSPQDSEKLAILYSTRGAYRRAAGELSVALADQDAAIRLRPRSAVLYFNRAISHQANDAPDRAMADLDEAIRLSPEFIPAYRTRADLFYDKKDFSSAIRDYDTAVRLSPNDATALTMRGLSKWQLGDAAGGKTDIGAAMRIDVAATVGLVSKAKPVGPIATASAVPPSMLWTFKGSQVALRMEGDDRRFFYEVPRPDLVVAGVIVGTLLFEGRADADRVTGKAFTFSRKCGARSFNVTGSIEQTATTETIRLSGRRPNIDVNCKPTGRSTDDVLVFVRPVSTQQPESGAKSGAPVPDLKGMPSSNLPETTTRLPAVGGKGGNAFDDASANGSRASITGIKIITNLNPADHAQQVIGAVQSLWGDKAGPVYGGRGPLAQPSLTFRLEPGEQIRKITIYAMTFNFPATPAPVWVSGLKITTSKSSYRYGELKGGSRSECVVGEGQRLIGFHGRSGSYIDQLGCIMARGPLSPSR